MEMARCFSAKALKRYSVDYSLCNECGFLSTERPYWLEEAYADAISAADTGLVARNIAICRRLSVLLFANFGPHGRYVDIAGGTGLLVRLMRDVGFDFWWRDRYCQNIHARGFEFRPSDQRNTAATAFEVIEHLDDPLGFIKEMLVVCQTDTLILSTELFEGDPPLPGNWWYYSFETGQHIAFYQRRTLQKIAGLLGMKCISFGSMHLLSKQNMSPVLFRAATGRMGRLAWPLVRRFMASRIMQDHYTMVGHTRGEPVARQLSEVD